MKKLLIVYNPRSSHHAAVKREILESARSLRGWMVGKYEIKPTSFADNVQNLMRLVSDGDLVIVAGGDGTATMTMNGVLEARKDATVGVVGYGNLNDIAGMLGTRRDEFAEDGAKAGFDGVAEILKRYEEGKVTELYALDVKVNDRHWRYAPCYYTMGLLAQATTMMEGAKVRKKLNTGKMTPWYSLRTAVWWYLKHRKGIRLPEGSLNGAMMEVEATDYLAVNGPSVARIMKGGEYWRDTEEFGSTVQRLGKFWKMVGFGLTSVRKGIPLAETKGDVIEFAEPSTVEMHVEGEYERMTDVKKVEVRKGEKSLKVIVGK